MYGIHTVQEKLNPLYVVLGYGCNGRFVLILCSAGANISGLFPDLRLAIAFDWVQTALGRLLGALLQVLLVVVLCWPKP